MRWQISFVSFMVLCSCNRALPKDEYMAWVKSENNGLLVSRTIGSLKISAQYKPAELRLLEQEESIEPDQYDKVIAEFKELQYFELMLLDKRGDLLELTETTSEKSELLDYFSFRMQNDISLIDGVDTLECKVFHFVRSYDLKNEKKFILAFESKSTKITDKTLVVDLNLLQTGIIKLVYPESVTSNFPSLKM